MRGSIGIVAGILAILLATSASAAVGLVSAIANLLAGVDSPACVGCGVSVGATVAPSWVSATLAAWMLDETTGTRVNAQGTATRNFAMVGTVPNDPTNKMQGTAAAVLTDATTRLSVSDTALLNLVSPLSVGCWVRPTAASVNNFVMGRWPTNGILLNLDNTPAYSFQIQIPSNPLGTVATPATLNSFTHVVGTYAEPAMKIYKNGVVAATGTIASGTLGTSGTSAWEISSSAWFYTGQIDECFVTNTTLSATSVCRICSCGLDGALCTCSGTTFVSTGRNATSCGACALPADCSAATPS